MPDSDNCNYCGVELHVGDYPFCPHGRMHRALDPGTHPMEKVVVFESAQEGGHIQYTGHFNDPVPERLKARGYVRRELNVSELASFEKKHHVMNERRHFDRNGRGLGD